MEFDFGQFLLAAASFTGGTGTAGAAGGQEGRSFLQNMWWLTRMALLGGAIRPKAATIAPSSPQVSHAPG